MPRLAIHVEGIVQGVGFRPFVYNLAARLELSGWVLNDARGVRIEIEGPRTQLDTFLHELKHQHPPLAHLARIQVDDCPEENLVGFEIKHSETGEYSEAQVAPDTYVCPDCLKELFDPNNRRYRYPFINCLSKGLSKLAREERLELPTPGFGDQCSAN